MTQLDQMVGKLLSEMYIRATATGIRDTVPIMDFVLKTREEAAHWGFIQACYLLEQGQDPRGRPIPAIPDLAEPDLTIA